MRPALPAAALACALAAGSVWADVLPDPPEAPNPSPETPASSPENTDNRRVLLIAGLGVLAAGLLFARRLETGAPAASGAARPSG